MPRPVRSAEIVELRALCASIDLGSLGRAARLMQVSQPALSKRLRSLEALAGARLLDRSSRGVRPTPAGERLYAEARKLLAQAETIDALLGGLDGDDGPVRVAASHTIAEYVLPGPLVEFETRRERHLSVELVIANSAIVRTVVLDGRADFGIAAAEPEAEGRPTGFLRELPFMEDEVVVAVPRDHPWARRSEVEIDDLLATPMVMRDPGANTRRVVDAALAERGLALAPSLAEVGSTSAARAAAISEGAPVLLSSLALPENGVELVRCAVRGVRFARRFVILLSAEETLAPAPLALLNHLRTDAPQRAVMTN